MANRPTNSVSRRMHAGIKYYSENLIFGIPTTSWGRTDIELFLNSSGLKLVDLEFAGRESKKNIFLRNGNYSGSYLRSLKPAQKITRVRGTQAGISRLVGTFSLPPRVMRTPRRYIHYVG